MRMTESELSEFEKELTKDLPQEKVKKLENAVKDLVKQEFQEIETAILSRMFDIDNENDAWSQGWVAGPLYLTCRLNQLGFGIWTEFAAGSFTCEINFLWFTLGLDIPLGVKEEK